MADFYDALDLLLESQVENYGQEGERPFYRDPNNPSHYVDGMLIGSAWGIPASEYYHVKNSIPTRNYISRLDLADAANFYRETLWNQILGDQIRDQEIANCIMDGYHHIGSYAINILQCLCRQYGHQVKISGKMDRRTVIALNMLTDNFPSAIFNRFNDARRQILLHIYGKEIAPSWKACFLSWQVPELYTDFNNPLVDLESQIKRVGRAGQKLASKDKRKVLPPHIALSYTGSLRTIRMCILVSITAGLLLYCM